MNPNGMVFVLVMILVGVPIMILVYYGAQLALRLLRCPAPAQAREGWRTTAGHSDSSPAAAAPGRVGVARPQPAVSRVLPLHECGLPYASRSG
jgi:hypothetical protein